MNKEKTSLLSWAIPKSRFPEKNEKILAIQTVNHKLSYLYFEGRLSSGDIVTLFDRGNCTIMVYRHNLIVVNFDGGIVKAGAVDVGFGSDYKHGLVSFC